MNILVTGGAGFIGTNLIKRLLKDKHLVVSIDNYATGKKENHQDGCVYIEGDIKNIKELFSWNPKLGINWKPDIVFHLAALARIQPSFKHPLEYFQINSLGTYIIAEFCSENNIPIIFAGSSSHHSGKFKNPYTFSKDISEEIIELYQCLYNLKSSITRFYNVYGPNHLKEGAYCTVIGKWENAIENNTPIEIYGDGTKRRDFTHVDDIVNALVLIMEKQSWGYIFELGRGKNYSIQEIANMFNHYIMYKDDKPGEALVTLCVDQLAKEILNWEAKLNIEDYIKNYLHENNLQNK